MAYNTLSAVAEGGGARTSETTATDTTFFDNYTQTVGHGLKNVRGTIDFSYRDYYAEAHDVETFLLAQYESGAPFWYTFYKGLEPQRLYTVAQNVTFTNSAGGDAFTVATTFREYVGT